MSSIRRGEKRRTTRTDQSCQRVCPEGGGETRHNGSQSKPVKRGARRRPLIDFVMMETHSPFYSPILASIPPSPLHRKRTKKRGTALLGGCLLIGLSLSLPCAYLLCLFECVCPGNYSRSFLLLFVFDGPGQEEERWK